MGGVKMGDYEELTKKQGEKQPIPEMYRKLGLDPDS